VSLQRRDFLDQELYVGNLNEIFEAFTSAFISAVLKMSGRLNLATTTAQVSLNEKQGCVEEHSGPTKYDDLVRICSRSALTNQ